MKVDGPATITSLILSEVRNGDGLSPSSVARTFSERGGRPGVHPTTIFRWMTKGVLCPDGRRVRLESVRIGSRYWTTWAAVERFVAATSGSTGTELSPPAPRSPTARQQASRRAERELADGGW